MILSFRTFARAALVSLLAVSSSGCMTAAALYLAHEEKEQRRLSARPPASEYAWAQSPGVAVSGRVYLTTEHARRYGAMVRVPRETLTCEGLQIRLVPDTPHLRWILSHQFGLGVSGAGYWASAFTMHSDWRWPSESRSMVREAKCGDDGAFRFDNVPDGPWFVMAQIHPPSWSGDQNPDTVLQSVRIRSHNRPVVLDVRLGGNEFLNGPIERH